MDSVVKILIIDDHQIFREGIKGVLETEPLFKVITERSGANFMDFVEKYNPDITLIDISLLDANDEEAMKNILSRTKVMILSFDEDKITVINAIKTGVHGYLLKSMDASSIISAIWHVHNGGSFLHPKVTHHVVDAYKKMEDTAINCSLKSTHKQPLHLLSRRECQVLQLLAEGNNNKSISDLLGISPSTCKNHVNSILRKMNVNGRTHAVVKAVQNGWVKLEMVNHPLSS